MNNLYFLVPPEQGKPVTVTGTVAERVVEGLYLCFYGGDPVIGRLVSVDAMLNWQLFANPRDLNTMLARYSQAAESFQQPNALAERLKRPRQRRKPTPVEAAAEAEATS